MVQEQLGWAMEDPDDLVSQCVIDLGSLIATYLTRHWTAVKDSAFVEVWGPVCRVSVESL